MPPGQECRSSRRFVAGHKPAKTFHTFSCGGFEIDWWQPGGFLRAAASGGRAGEAEWGRGGLHLQPDHGIQLTIVNNNNIKWSITTINKNNKLTIATVNNITRATSVGKKNWPWSRICSDSPTEWLSGWNKSEMKSLQFQIQIQLQPFTNTNTNCTFTDLYKLFFHNPNPQLNFH